VREQYGGDARNGKENIKFSIRLKLRMTMEAYVSWLKNRNMPVYEMAGTYWRSYQKALIPASLKPEPIIISEEQGQQLLERSGALLLRYFTHTVKYPTSFWYSACKEYDIKNLSQKVRGRIRRGYKSCSVKRIDPLWLADNGYACYASAFSRYRNAEPDSKEQFDAICRWAVGGPFEFWGVFVGDTLAGFEKFAVGHDYAASLVLKLDPNYIHESIGPALKDTTLSAYVTQQQKTMYNGFRSVIHETNTHDFLLTLGFSRVYCDLKIIYRPAVKACVDLLYNHRPLLNRLPESTIKSKILGLLSQEEIRRSIEFDGKRPYRANILERIVRSVWGNRYGASEK
jgi:hypothetical protein